jgi:hypothetical protein
MVGVAMNLLGEVISLLDCRNIKIKRLHFVLGAHTTLQDIYPFIGLGFFCLVSHILKISVCLEHTLECSIIILKICRN